MPRLNKKYVVQKSYRIDSAIASDLEVLSKILERSQNDLVNVAIEQLLIENAGWFKFNVFVDRLGEFFEGSIEEDEITIQGITLHASHTENDEFKFEVTVKDRESNDIIETFTRILSLEGDVVEKTLRELTRYIDLNTPELERYIKNRICYK